jgi:hypothetical protein
MNAFNSQSNETIIRFVISAVSCLNEWCIKLFNCILITIDFDSFCLIACLGSFLLYCYGLPSFH